MRNTPTVQPRSGHPFRYWPVIGSVFTISLLHLLLAATGASSGHVVLAQAGLPGINVTPLSGLLTAEDGQSANFQVALITPPEPGEVVTVALESSLPGEGLPAPTSLAFTAADWSVPQIVTVAGVDDPVDDGDQDYTINTLPATSTLPGSAYDGLDAADPALTNRDDDTAGWVINPSGGLTTSENGQTDSFTLRLASQPLAPVTITVQSSSPTEAITAPSSLTFDDATWQVDQTVTVTGQDDSLVDGDQAYTIDLTAASSDPAYQASPPAIQAQNLDNEQLTVTAQPDSYSLPAGQVFIQAAPGVLINDSTNGSGLSSELKSSVSHGALALLLDGSFAYSPAPGFSGQDSFTYAARSGLVLSNPVTVTLTVVPVNQPPTAANDTFITNATVAVPLSVAAPGVLANDSDPENTVLTAALVTTPASGTLTLRPDGSFTYTPPLGFNGQVSFTYQATDAAGGSATAQAQITVDTSPPPAPVWLKPGLNGSINEITSGNILLEVNIEPSVSDIGKVVFYRWDPNKGVRIEIGAVKKAPYSISVDSAIMSYFWNQIDAGVFDLAGNRSGLQHIWIMRALPPVAYLVLVIR